MAASHDHHPILQRFLIANARPTGRQLGVGSYGSVEELEVNGVVCAGKKIHETLIEQGNFGAEYIASRYEEECQLLSDLRHPHLVQFLGVCFLPDSTLPVLVMECLVTSLDELLEHNPDIPLSLKRSILEDVARGLVYLHSHSPPVIHRDLSARNVLLNSAMVAKIADLGIARIVNFQPGQLARTLSRIPGTIVYMPPEAFKDAAKYGPSLDIFSFGHLFLFTITQVFPGGLLPYTYRDPENPRHRLARTEVQQRDEYIKLLHKQMGEQHPLVLLVKQCLVDEPTERPSAQELLQQLEGMRTQIEDPYQHLTKLDAIKMLKEKDQHIHTQMEVSGESPLACKDPKMAEKEDKESGVVRGGAAVAAVSPVDLMAKVDIRGELKADLMKELGDKRSKIRGKALQKVQAILASAKIIQPSLGRLPETLKWTLWDSNKNLVVSTLDIIGSLATAMGSDSSKFSKAFIPRVLGVLADSKPQVRQAAISCLNAWHAEITLVPFIEQKFISSALATKSAILKMELLTWLEEKLRTAGKHTAELSLIVPHLFSCLEDRSSDVRKKAQMVLSLVMAMVGYDSMLQHTDKLKKKEVPKKASLREDSVPGGDSGGGAGLKRTHYQRDADGLSIQYTVSEQDFEERGWAIPSDSLQKKSLIGKGEFREGWLGEYEGQKVAMMMTKDLRDPMARELLLAEAAIMTALRHPNLVRLIGITLDKPPIYFITEYMAKGSLLFYLRSRGIAVISKLNQLDFARDVCRGMVYLETQNLVHRSLAARNVLIGDDNIAKVSDFRLTREGLFKTERREKLLVKWTAPEALREMIFSTKSDVWSFGILLWEIYSYGKAPYFFLSVNDVLPRIERGGRMGAPSDCPDDIYQIMRACWDKDPSLRPNFARIENLLDSI